MEGWMIAMISVAAVILLLAVAFIIGAFAALKYVLGRRKRAPSGENPEAYGVDLGWFDELKDSTDTLELTAYDNINLKALRIKNSSAENQTKVAICYHGYGATPRSVQPQAKIFFDKGFDVVLPAARAHSISDGKYVGMAWIDRFDLMRWIDKVIALYGSDVEIALIGVSMGGSTVIATAGMTPPPQVKCVIDDCGYSSQIDEYAACLKKIKLPLALKLLPLSVGVRLRLGYSIAEADIVPLAQNMSLPALFIHGADDKFVPLELGQKLYDACASEDKRFVAVDGARHAQAYAKDPENYKLAVCELIDKYM